jgi:16S rRNA processing protein RimM
MEQRLKVGVITATHGIKGEVKVFPLTDDVSRFKDLKKVYLDTKKEVLTLEITSVKFFKNQAILKFKGIDTINDIEKYKHCELLIDRSDAVPLEEDEYFIADLIGLDVYTEENESLGKTVDVITTGANDVYVIKGEKYGEILIPAIKECILKIDIKESKLFVHLLDGLLEL